ncbi:hypothetical protein AZA_56479 [Nitrospirillum viridazoti Y2]|nr:hypothetical protein AZA_56479 [Nitrospirillum amazonense Y2]
MAAGGGGDVAAGHQGEGLDHSLAAIGLGGQHGQVEGDLVIVVVHMVDLAPADGGGRARHVVVVAAVVGVDDAAAQGQAADGGAQNHLVTHGPILPLYGDGARGRARPLYKATREGQGRETRGLPEFTGR